MRAVLPTIRVPTLVVQHADDPFIPPAKGKYIAEHIPGAKYVELPGRNVYHFVEPWRDSFQEIAEFLTGQQADVADDRVLATVLFTDIVDSTRRAAEMGDRDWHALLDAHDAVVRSQLARFRGREVNTSGDGFLAMFDGPQRAIRCAMAIRDAVQALGIEVRAGLHTGECEVRGDDIGGIAVHIGARVSALAGPNDVLVSSTLRDLVIGSDWSSRSAALTSSRACPASGTCSPSPLRSGGFRQIHLACRKQLMHSVTSTEALEVRLALRRALERRRSIPLRHKSVVESAFGVDGLGVLWARVFRRLGIITPRSPVAVGYGWFTDPQRAGGSHSVGNRCRLPGSVV